MNKLEIKNVQLGYGSKTVINDLNLEITEGQIIGIIGPNGSGKSTIIKAISRVIPLRSGKIFLNSTDINRIPRKDFACILGVVPQIPLLPSTFSAFDIVLMGRNPHLGLLQHEGPKEFDIAWQAMKKTGTDHLADRRINELSGGEIQSLLIARVLAQETQVILLDEPTANLDIGRQSEILELIKQLCFKENLIVIAAIHDLNLATQYCDRLVLINEQKIQAEGTPKDVITNENIKAAYGAKDCVYNHPVNGLPVVLLKANNIAGDMIDS